MHLSERARSVSLSLTLALDARAKAMAADGVDVINMAVGEPDFPAPAAAQEAAVARVRSGDVRYTAASGEAPLRAALAAQLSATRGVPFTPDQVVVCHSAKHALSGTFQTLCDDGDEVVLLLPAWGSFEEIVRLAGARPVGGMPRADGGPDCEAIEAAFTSRTRALLVNNPSNPSGYVWSPEEMERLVALTAQHGISLVSDEIYRRLVYEGPPSPSPVQFGDEARARTIVIDGPSKTYAMTGYRIGCAAGPPEVIAAMGRVQSQMTGSPNAVSQSAWRACLNPKPPEVAAMVEEFSARRKILLDGFERLGLPCHAPRGAFYGFPDVSAHFGAGGSVEFCERLLDEQHLVTVPGAAFGTDAHVRFSYAVSRERIEEALERLARVL